MTWLGSYEGILITVNWSKRHELRAAHAEINDQHAPSLNSEFRKLFKLKTFIQSRIHWQDVVVVRRTTSAPFDNDGYIIKPPTTSMISYLYSQPWIEGIKSSDMIIDNT